MINHPNRSQDRGPWVVLDVPHQMPAKVWTAYGRGDFIDRAYSGSRTAFERTTVKELLDCYTAEEVAETEKLAQWAALPGDTVLYRSDFLCREGEYQLEAIDELEAAEAANGDDLSASYIVKSETEAVALFEQLTGPNAPRIGRAGPIAASAAFRKECQRHGWLVEAEAEETEE